MGRDAPGTGRDAPGMEWGHAPGKGGLTGDGGLEHAEDGVGEPNGDGG